VSIAASRGLDSPDIFNMSMNHENENVPVGLLLIDVLSDFDMKGVVILWLGRSSSPGDENFKL
jgi:hypothetical protein